VSGQLRQHTKQSKGPIGKLSTIGDWGRRTAQERETGGFGNVKETISSRDSGEGNSLRQDGVERNGGDPIHVFGEKGRKRNGKGGGGVFSGRATRGWEDCGRMVILSQGGRLLKKEGARGNRESR